MSYDRNHHHRRSIRLQGYDYSQVGAYFVTVVTRNRECLFGAIVDDVMRLTSLGMVVYSTWNDLPAHYLHVELDAFVVMPNHVHGIIVLSDNVAPPVGAGLKPAPTRHTLSEIVRGLKTFSARRINETRGTPGSPVWQRNYYEHIIRDETSLERIRQYIRDNPALWATDAENPRSRHL
ncbi:MAG: transposase [Anaerolineae bacterium]